MVTRVLSVNRVDDYLSVSVQFEDGAGFVTSKVYRFSLHDNVTTDMLITAVQADIALYTKQLNTISQFEALVGTQLTS